MSISDTPIFDQMNAWLKETKGVSYDELVESMKPITPRLRLSKGKEFNRVRVDESQIPDGFLPPEEDHSSVTVTQEELIQHVTIYSTDQTVRMASSTMLDSNDDSDLLFTPRPYMANITR